MTRPPRGWRRREPGTGDLPAPLPDPVVPRWPGWLRLLVIVGLTAGLWLAIWAVI